MSREEQYGITICDLDELDGHEFENYLAILFNNLGYYAELTPGSGDYGADLILTKDGVRIAVQAKRSSKKVTLRAVQEVIGAKRYYKCDEAWVVTNNFYTNSAIDLARSDSVVLMDRSAIKNMLKAQQIEDQNKASGSQMNDPELVRLFFVWTLIFIFTIYIRQTTGGPYMVGIIYIIALMAGIFLFIKWMEPD